MNRKITTNESQAVIKNPQQTKVMEWMASQVEFYQTFMEVTASLKV